ncbi:MAG: hypothetical protein BWZ10_02343 [candidate division BRC1 bacterium ADurb.BinA364]|nr:MAG: hypothetical protein BWZ10_02343 [candidate division BRC1 bacterium ADurb.BinA364]
MEAGRLLRRSGKRGFDCAAAGRRAAAIYANGDLALCEFTPPFGNLREHGMDFARAWSSPEADAMRQRIRPCHFPRAGCLSKNTEYPRRP